LDIVYTEVITFKRREEGGGRGKKGGEKRGGRRKWRRSKNVRRDKMKEN